MNRIFAFAALVFSIAAFSIAAPSYKSVQSIQYYAPSGWDSTNANQPGGVTKYYLANDSLRLGDVVYLSAANKVAKSATLADYNTLTGVVVGGVRTSMNANINRDTTQTLVATANQRVVVLRQGRYWLKCDTTTGGIAAGVQVIPSLVAGKVKARTTAIDTNFRVLARMVTACTASGIGAADINVR